MLRTQFEEELNKLHNQFYSMGTQVSAQLNKAVRAFVSRDSELAQQVVDEDKEINSLEVKLETKSFELIALQQPVSQDLRTIVTVLKASSDLERMGDHAAYVAGSVLTFREEEDTLGVEADFTLLGEKAKTMLDASLNAYIQGDEVRAVEIASWDHAIDDMAEEIQGKILEILKDQADSVRMGKEYIMNLMHLERIGDSSRNLCEWIVYLKSGEVVEL